MTKALSAEEKARRSKSGGGRNGRKHAGKKEGEPDQATDQVEATTEAATPAQALPPVQDDHTAVTANGSVTAESTANPPPAVAAPAKKTLTTQQTLTLGLTRLAKDRYRRRQELLRIDAEQEQLRTAITALGMEVPPDAEEEPVKTGKTNAKKTTGDKRTNTGAMKVAGGLWAIVAKFLWTKGFVAPKFCDAKALFELAQKHGYSTAANLLSQKSKDGTLVKEGRGNYALPKGTKTSPV